MKSMKTILEHKDGYVHVEKLPTGKNRIFVELINDNLFLPIKTCETSYPIDLIGKILDHKGLSYLCNEILRDESPNNVEKPLKYGLLVYLKEEEFNNKRLLDFGCGSGASTMILARMFPHTEIVGIDLEASQLSIAQHRTAYYGYKNIQLLLSTSPESLPPNIGTFNYIVLNAVYEHLLPNEREPLLSQIWSILQDDGILFINETPYRYFPIEMHTSGGLPFINYLPDKLALRYAQNFSKRRLKNISWEELLRRGIRGGSVKEILNILSRCPATPVLLNPSRYGMKDRIDVWYSFQFTKVKSVVVKKLLLFSLKLWKHITGTTIVPTLSLAIKKAE